MSGAALGVVVVTNFSIRRAGILPGIDWITSRFDLLKRTAYPSLVSQRVDGLLWLLRASGPVAAYVTSLAAQIPLPRGHVVVTTPQDQAGAVAGFFPGAERFLTARLDSDDAFLPTALPAALAACGVHRGPEPMLFNFRSGYQLDWRTGSMFPLTFPDVVQGPFLAVTNRGRDSMLDYGGEHRQARGGRSVVDIEGPQWIQVVHGENLRNRIASGADPVPRAEAEAAMAASGVCP